MYSLKIYDTSLARESRATRERRARSMPRVSTTLHIRTCAPRSFALCTSFWALVYIARDAKMLFTSERLITFLRFTLPPRSSLSSTSFFPYRSAAMRVFILSRHAGILIMHLHYWQSDEIIV